MTNYSICVFPGDGIGSEVTECSLEVLTSLQKFGGPSFTFETHPAGHGTYLEQGHAMPEMSMKKAKEADSVLVGAMDVAQIPPGGGDPLRDLRVGLEVGASVRPSRTIPGIESPVKKIDCVIVREVTEGLYSRIEYMGNEDTACAVRLITRGASSKTANMAFQQAIERQSRANSEHKVPKVTAVHKVGALKLTDGLFLKSVKDVSLNFPNVKYETRNIDACALEMIREPESFDVILSTNTFGDILSDVAAGLSAGLGLAASGCIGEKWAYFEPVHGTAPDIAGKGIANPCASILSAAMMVRHLGETNCADVIENAVYSVISKGKTRTGDLGGNATSKQMTTEIIDEISRITK